MVDVKGLPAGVTLTAGDFEFRSGNDSNLAAWALAPTPSSITVRRGAGSVGTDRVTLIWPDYDPSDLNSTVNAVANKWLRITVKATPNTGLIESDVFYYGNLIGEGYVPPPPPPPEPPQDPVISALDLSGTKARQGQTADLNSLYDFNRDAIIDDVDLNLAKQNLNKSIILLTAPA